MNVPINFVLSAIEHRRRTPTMAPGCLRGEIHSSDAKDLYILLKGKVDPGNLGLCLRLSHQDIENLKDETRKNNDLLSAVLNKWFIGSAPPVCWETFIEAVRCADNVRLASELKEQHP